MHATREFDRIESVLREEEPERPLTAREIHSLLAERGEEFASPHRVATVLGREARTGDVDVIRSSPYRYRVRDAN